MHWTALLEKRYFPAHARVIGDVRCVGCGHNLRQARAAGPCLEWGRPVTDSLWALAHPDEVATGLRRIARSHIGLAVIALVAVPLSLLPATAGCFGWVAALCVAAAAIARLSGAADLRFRSSIESLPGIGPRVRLVWALALLEVPLAAAFGLALTAGNPGGAGWRAAITIAALAAWPAAACASHAVAGWMGSALAAMLDDQRLARSLRTRSVLVAIGPALALGLSGAAGRSTVAVLLGCLGLAWLIATLVASYGLLELAGRAEAYRAPLDNLVDAGRTHGRPRVRDALELPDIGLDGD
jgi:hypothetical protein